MPQGVQAFAVLLLLLPGFLSARIVQMMCARPKQTELDKIVEALLFSFLTYLLFAATLGTELPLSWSARFDQLGTHYILEIRRLRLALLALYAVVLGLGWAWIVNHDSLLKWLRKGRFTQRTSRISVWNDIFHTLGGTVQIGLKDGRMVRGWLRCYSDEAEDSTFFLEAATWIGEDGADYPVNGPGILFTKECGVQFVIFLNEVPQPPARGAPDETFASN
jgi:Family of unknown function (DUF6338)